MVVVVVLLGTEDITTVLATLPACDCGTMFTLRTVMLRFRMAGFRLASWDREFVLIRMVFVPGIPGANWAACPDPLEATTVAGEATFVGMVMVDGLLPIGRIWVSPTRTKFFIVVVLLGSTLMMTGWNFCCWWDVEGMGACFTTVLLRISIFWLERT